MLQLLNAKPENVERESEIVAQSGRSKAVTIATNMAGRGTDIILGGNPEYMARYAHFTLAISLYLFSTFHALLFHAFQPVAAFQPCWAFCCLSCCDCLSATAVGPSTAFHAVSAFQPLTVVSTIRHLWLSVTKAAQAIMRLLGLCLLAVHCDHLQPCWVSQCLCLPSRQQHQPPPPRPIQVEANAVDTANPLAALPLTHVLNLPVQLEAKGAAAAAA